MIGFIACSVTGFILSWILTFVFVFSGMATTPYAIIFALCQVLNIASSCFLSTPKGHLKAMKKKHRIVPSVLYIVSIILVVVIAVATHIKGLTFLFVVLCTFCYYWYTISFIPYGTKILKKCCGVCFDIAWKMIFTCLYFRTFNWKERHQNIFSFIIFFM